VHHPRLARPLATVVACLATAATAAAAPAERLAAAGHGASSMADLWWWTAVGSATAWLAAIGFLVYCWRARRS
jgi:hypothetical protein